MEINIKKIKINLLDGEYIFDDGNEVRKIKINNYPGKAEILRSEIKEEYDLSKELISKVNLDLYECLQEYDYEMGTNYLTKYLNVIVKEIPKQSGESRAEYIKREKQTRKELLEKAGITGVTGIDDKVSLIDRLKMTISTRKQKRTNIDTDENEEKDIEPKQEVFVEDESKQEEPEIKIDEKVDLYDRQYIFAEGFSSEIFGDYKKEHFETQQDKKSKSISYREAEEVVDDTETSKNSDKPVVSKPKKAISRRQSIQASKRALRESRKLKNRYKQKIQEDNERKDRIYKAQREREGIDIIDISGTSTKKGKKSQTVNLANKKRRKLDAIEMRNGTILGADENRPSAIVKTFVIEIPEKEVESHEKEDKTPKKESVVKRYTRKLKDKADSIRNKVCSDKKKLLKATLGGVAGIIALAGVATVATIVPKYFSVIPLDEEYTSETQIQAYDIDEKINFRESDDNKTSVVSFQAVADVKKVFDDKKDIIEDKFEEKNTFTSYVKENTDTNKEKKSIDKKEKEEKDASKTYLESIRVGSRMTIDKGVYFETPEGTGNCGSFENHAGEAKIISQIGIATDDGYISVTTDDVTLLELKEKYPDAKFSYHIVDEKGHILGWLTSESLQENLLENQQQVDDGMDR